MDEHSFSCSAVFLLYLLEPFVLVVAFDWNRDVVCHGRGGGVADTLGTNGVHVTADKNIS